MHRSIVSRCVVSGLGLLIALWICGSYGCSADPVRPPEVPAERLADALRGTPPPAAAEAADLERRAHAAGIASAEALARGDQPEADRRRILRAELDRLRAEAEQLAAHQQQQLDRAIATAEADAVAQRGELEDRRIAAAAAAKLEEWRDRCRWVGLIGLLASLALGGVIGWMASPMAGVGCGSLGVIMSLACAAYGAALTWLPVGTLVSLVLSAAVWLIYHVRQQGAAAALSRTVDALEGTATVAAGEAKALLGTALSQAGPRLRARLQAQRQAWKS